MTGWEQARFDLLRRLLLVLLTFLLPVSQLIEAGGKKINFSYADLVLPLAVLLLGWRMITSGLRFPMPMLFLASVGLVALSTIANLERALDLRGPVSQVVELVKLLSLWVYFYTMANFLDDRRDFLLMLKTWIVSSALVAALGTGGSLAYQYAGIESVFSLQFRAQGTFDDANLFSAHCGLSLMLTLLYVRLTSSWWALGAVPVLGAGILFSASRGSLMSVGLALALLTLVFAPAWLRLGVGFVAVMAVLAVLAMPEREEFLAANPVTARLTTTTVDLNNPEALQRRELWEVAWKTWQANPWLGVGKGNYGMGEGGEAGAIGVAHSTYLGTLAELGIAGFLVYFLGAGRLVGPAIFSVFRARDLAAAILLGGLMVILLAGVTISIENYRGLWVLLAVFEAYRRIILGPSLSTERRGAGRESRGAPGEAPHAHAA
jgi:O-antigen ligase